MTDIQFTDVTDGDVDGPGVFDQLMKSMSAHLTKEFDKNRITGKEYATVYLGGLQAAMQQAITFILQEQVADKQAELLTQQVASELKNNETNGVIDKQKDLLDQQIAKTTNEASLIDQKTATEEAQTLDTTLSGSNPGTVAGVILKQKDLFAKQTDGFDRDAEQKATKILMDSFNIRRTTDQGELPPTKADNLDIDEFIKNLASGVNVTLPGNKISIGGSVSGLVGSGIVLKLTAISGGSGPTITELLTPLDSSDFKFTQGVPENYTYTVTVDDINSGYQLQGAATYPKNYTGTTGDEGLGTLVDILDIGVVIEST